MESVEKVAWLALAYQELGARAECRDDASSLLVKMAAGQLNELDEHIVYLLDKVEELGVFMVELADLEPLRYEALLHAWPPGLNNDPPPDGLPWKPYIGERWDEVEEKMDWFRALGITATRGLVDEIADEAYARAMAARVG